MTAKITFTMSQNLSDSQRAEIVEKVKQLSGVFNAKVVNENSLVHKFTGEAQIQANAAGIRAAVREISGISGVTSVNSPQPE